MTSRVPGHGRGGIKAILILGSLLLVFVGVWVGQRRSQPPAVNQLRLDERRSALAEQRTNDAGAVHHYGWVDASRGVVRVPVSNAMELTVQEYRDPGAARSNLWQRLERATAPPVGAVPAPGAPR
jgi:hypothetical protein